MQITAKRVGAVVLATSIFASSFGAATSGAVAQDRAELQADPAAAETVETEASSDATQPQVRFVASEAVQEIPEQPEVEEAAVVDAGSLRQLVDTVDTGGSLTSELMCLAQAVYFESRGEPLDGQLAVANVVINRAEDSRFPDSYCSVVTQRSQFSFVRNGRIPAPRTGTTAWQRAKAIARIAHRDMWESEAGDSLYFHATHVSPRWAGRMTARAQINSHIFYR